MSELEVAKTKIASLLSEVERLKTEADSDFGRAAVRIMLAYPGFDARDYAEAGITADDFEEFFTEDMNEAWRLVQEAWENVETLQARAERAEAALNAIASHDNAFLIDGSAATRQCVDWMVRTARAGSAVEPFK